MGHWMTFVVTAFTALIAMVNPVTNIPIFLGLTSGFTKKQKMVVAKKACWTAFLIMLGFIVLGKLIFTVFGITIPAFKITGGILIAKIGFNMLQSKETPSKKTKNQDELPDELDDSEWMSVAVTPLAIPLLAGPGMIVTTANFITDDNYWKLAAITVIVGVVLGINYISLRSGDFIVNKLGSSFINVLDKLMGLILAIMGVGMLLNGIDMWRGWPS